MFIIGLSAVLGLMHLYLWKRLVKDTTQSGRTRWILTAILIALAALLVATLIAPRVFGLAESGWFAWPGYFWFGLIVYLFLTLLVLEPVRLALRGRVKRKAPETTETITTKGEPAGTALNRRLFLARVSAVAAGAASVSLVGVGASNALGPPDLLVNNIVRKMQAGTSAARRSRNGRRMARCDDSAFHRDNTRDAGR